MRREPGHGLRKKVNFSSVRQGMQLVMSFPERNSSMGSLTPSSITSNERLHYLDALRAFVMSIGVVLHASLIAGVHNWGATGGHGVFPSFQNEAVRHNQWIFPCASSRKDRRQSGNQRPDTTPWCADFGVPADIQSDYYLHMEFKRRQLSRNVFLHFQYAGSASGYAWCWLASAHLVFSSIVYILYLPFIPLTHPCGSARKGHGQAQPLRSSTALGS